MYNEILEGVFEKKGIYNSSQMQDYLRSLRNKLKEVRISYNKYPVQINYDDPETQAIYLLAYFPHYTDILLHVLNSIDSRLVQNINELDFLGCGPCPEIISLLKYYDKLDITDDKNLIIRLYDKSISEWEWSRDIVFSKVLPIYKGDIGISSSVNFIDISRDFELKFSTNPRICVFQNCLNEFTPTKQNRFIQNVTRLFDSLSDGSIIVFVDLHYDGTFELLKSIESKLEKKHNCEILSSVEKDTLVERTSHANEPKIILDNLLTDKIGQDNSGLLPRRNLRVIYSVFQKTQFVKETINDGNTYNQTFEYIKSGRNIDEIASIRMLNKETIIKHLVYLIENKPNQIFDRFKPDRAVISKVIQAIRMTDSGNALRPIYDYLNGEVSYDDIRLVLAFNKNSVKTIMKLDAVERIADVGSTYDQTFEFIKLGQSLDEIASIRGLYKETIIKHLVYLKKNNPDEIFERFRPDSLMIAKVKEAIHETGSRDTLQPIYDFLNEELSYDDIKLVLAYI